MLLDHLVYTCRVAYETIARSPGISLPVQRVLEDRAGAYPLGDWGVDAPLVFRAFPVQPGQPDGAFAVMLLRYSGTDYAGRRGNHLAHCFVIRPEQLADAADNLAWVAVHLPIWLGYRARATVDAIEPLSVAIDPLEQLDFLRFAVHELSPPVAVDLAGRIVARLSLDAPAPPLALPFGPPAPALAELMPLVCRGDEAPPPAPDLEVLNLWRLAGLLAILPRAYQRRVSFSLNEIEAPAGYALTVLRDPTAAATSSASATASSAFVAHAIALAQHDDLARLTRLLRWLDEALRTPSAAALDACLAFHRAIVDPDVPGAAPTPEVAIAALRALHPVTRHLAYAPFEASVLRVGQGADWWVPELSVLADRTGTAPSAALLEATLAALAIEPGTHPDEIAAREHLFAELPPRLRSAVWNAAEERGAFPVAAPVARGRDHSGLIASLRAAGRMWPELDDEARQRARDRLAAACVASLDAPALATRLDDVIALLAAAPLSAPMRRPLIRSVLAAMLRTRAGSTSRADLGSSLVQLLGTRPPAPESAAVVTELVVALAEHDAGFTARALLARPPDPATRGTAIERVRAIATGLGDRTLDDLADVQCELLRATMNELEVEPGPSELVAAMPRFARWIAPRPWPLAWRAGGERDALLREFVAELEADIRGMAPGLAILIVDAYLRARPTLWSLLSAALVRVEMATRETADWLFARTHLTAGGLALSPATAFAALLRRAAREGGALERHALEVAASVSTHLQGYRDGEAWRRVQRAWDTGDRMPRPWRELFPAPRPRTPGEFE